MDSVLLDSIEFKVNMDQLFKTLRLDRDDDDDAVTVVRMAEEAQAIARPKVFYKPAYIDSREDDFIVVDEVKFTSRILSVNLKGAHRVFPYVATCGTELEAWAGSITDMLESYWADAIMIQALASAMKTLDLHLEKNFNPGKTARMNPGSLKDWPINQQKYLFELLGDVKGKIGVSLTDSFLMVPVKSVSGIKFATESNYENCQLCPRESCPGRRVPYNKELHTKKYS